MQLLSQIRQVNAVLGLAEPLQFLRTLLEQRSEANSIVASVMVERGGDSAHVIAEGETYRLIMRPDDSWDAADFLRAVRGGLRVPDPEARPRLEAAVDAYGGTFRLIDKVFRPAGSTWSAADLTDLDRLDAEWPDGTAVVWVETPTNPALNIVDIEAVSELAHGRGARVVVDNTFATPYLQQPLRLGADAVVHSSTKYLGGHSDVVGGFVATSDDALADGIRFVQNAAGAVPSPFDCYLVLRGVKTLALRMDRHCHNARAVADMLVAHPAVDRVLWPGLTEHPGHDVAKRQMGDFGGMVSFTLRGGEQAALSMVRRTKVFTLAESLGAVESLIEHPARMTHASAAGSPLSVDSALVRLSVGIETTSDLIADLEDALPD